MLTNKIQGKRARELRINKRRAWKTVQIYKSIGGIHGLLDQNKLKMPLAKWAISEEQLQWMLCRWDTGKQRISVPLEILNHSVSLHDHHFHHFRIIHCLISIMELRLSTGTQPRIPKQHPLPFLTFGYEGNETLCLNKQQLHTCI